MRIRSDDDRCDIVMVDAETTAYGGCIVRAVAECDPPDSVTMVKTTNGTCGLDVTEAMVRLKAAIDTWWATEIAANGGRPPQAYCNGGWTDRQGRYSLGNGWDICELAHEKSRFCEQVGCCLGPEMPRSLPFGAVASDAGCRETVRVGGVCTKAHTLNYWLWGYMHRLCGDQFWSGEIDIYRWTRWLDQGVREGSEAIREDPLEIPERICWALRGCRGTFAIDPLPTPPDPQTIERWARDPHAATLYGHMAYYQYHYDNAYSCGARDCDACKKTVEPYAKDGVYVGELTAYWRIYGQTGATQIQSGRTTAVVALPGAAPIQACPE